MQNAYEYALVITERFDSDRNHWIQYNDVTKTDQLKEGDLFRYLTGIADGPYNPKHFIM